MSVEAAQHNVEIVRRLFDYFARRDLDSFLELLDPEIRTSPLSEAANYEGLDGVRQFFDSMRASGREIEAPFSEMSAFGDFVVSVGRIRVREKDGTLRDSPAVYVFELRGGRVVRITSHQDRNAAMAFVHEAA